MKFPLSNQEAQQFHLHFQGIRGLFPGTGDLFHTYADWMWENLLNRILILLNERRDHHPYTSHEWILNQTFVRPEEELVWQPDRGEYPDTVRVILLKNPDPKASDLQLFFRVWNHYNMIAVFHVNSGKVIHIPIVNDFQIPDETTAVFDLRERLTIAVRGNPRIPFHSLLTENGFIYDCTGTARCYTGYIIHKTPLLRFHPLWMPKQSFFYRYDGAGNGCFCDEDRELIPIPDLNIHDSGTQAPIRYSGGYCINLWSERFED